MSTWTRRRFLQHTALGAAALGVAPGAFAMKRTPQAIATQVSDSCPEVRSSVAVADPANIRILQFTDIHFFNGRANRGPARDEKTVEELHALVAVTEPDVIVVTGDLWHDNPDGRGAEFQAFAIAQLEQLGVPWAFTWGNHDMLDDYVAGHDALRGAERSLYRGGPGGGNYTVDLVDGQGTPVWEFICLNTTNVGIQPPQEAWIDALHDARTAAGVTPPPAFCMLHIPVLQYQYIWEEEIAAGFQFEAVCSWGEAGSGIWHLNRLGNVKALFCGHDHVNDYGGHLRGIELVYGRATGHAGYGGGSVRKGAKLIKADATTGAYTWESVFADGIRWRPAPDERFEEVIDAPWMRTPPLFDDGYG